MAAIAAILAAAIVAACATPGSGGSVTAYEGARLIIGDTSPPIDNGAFVVENGRFISSGRKGEVRAPAGAARVDLLLDLVVETRNSHHEELIEVVLVDRAEVDALQERHGFIEAQLEDVKASRRELARVIKAIDQEIVQVFVGAFADVSTHFTQLFEMLFPGGQARLRLTDPDNPLETGIEVEARPPGKKPQTMTLLSGGEQALTAMALIFAVFLTNPAPICVLDEVDAPLDDANIGRFVEMLQGMQGHTQFILITHNRKTMEIADRLYGVTMEEPGVSKLISVQLN